LIKTKEFQALVIVLLIIIIETMLAGLFFIILALFREGLGWFVIPIAIIMGFYFIYRFIKIKKYYPLLII